jgi:DivIVA domain-containing protein
MYLTSDEIATKRFTPTRFREGYDTAEVDEFLDWARKSLQYYQGRIRELEEQVGDN